jgi:hypothetical protein
MSHRAICLTGNHALRRTLRRTLSAAGSTVEFAEGIEGLTGSGGPDPDLIVLDGESRRGLDLAGLHKLTHAQIVVVGDSLGEDIFQLLRLQSFNHVISELQDGDDEELVVTSTKVLKKDIFGLEKYLAWGVLVRQRVVSSYDDKRDAVLHVSEYAEAVGARRQIISRIESVVDELLMNALYDAPAMRQGSRPRPGERGRSGHLASEPALLRYASDGRYFAVSVRDDYGELRKEAILDHLVRARAERTPKGATEDGGGAGLGLYFVLSSVTRFIANVCPGQMTEVVCLFDIKATGREQDAGAKSLHIFTISSVD